VFDEINKNCAKELAAVQAQYAFEPLKYRPAGQTLVIPFPEAVKMLRADGVQMGDFDDFTSVGTMVMSSLLFLLFLSVAPLPCLLSHSSDEMCLNLDVRLLSRHRSFGNGAGLGDSIHCSEKCSMLF